MTFLESGGERPRSINESVRDVWQLVSFIEEGAIVLYGKKRHVLTDEEVKLLIEEEQDSALRVAEEKGMLPGEERPQLH